MDSSRLGRYSDLRPNGKAVAQKFSVEIFSRTGEFEPSPQNEPTKKPDARPGFFVGTPREIRTPDTQVRSLVLYPAELWAHSFYMLDSARFECANCA